jgi:hypothetical protein
MKTISTDKTYMDYTSGETGIRVWEGRFQQLYRNSPDSDWSKSHGVLLNCPERASLSFHKLHSLSATTNRSNETRN